MIEINNESAIDVDETVLQRLTDFNLEQLHVSPDAEVAIVLVDFPPPVPWQKTHAPDRSRHAFAAPERR